MRRTAKILVGGKTRERGFTETKRSSYRNPKLMVHCIFRDHSALVCLLCVCNARVMKLVVGKEEKIRKPNIVLNPLLLARAYWITTVHFHVLRLETARVCIAFFDQFICWRGLAPHFHIQYDGFARALLWARFNCISLSERLIIAWCWTSCRAESSMHF